VAGLLVGLQIMANFFDEGRILQTAHAFEQALGQANTLPELD
jgi:Asp-tRNA(Asn)/Glu-tRNA(Gln) amidotransferase A subunit family amidase